MKLLSVTLAAMLAGTVQQVQAQNGVGTAGTTTFEDNYNKQRAAIPPSSGLTDEEKNLYAEMMAGRDVGHCGCTNNDPHVYTYDGLHTDCQGSGDYIYSKSLDSDFMVQARFSIEGTNSRWNAFTRTRSEEQFFGTAQKGGVINTGFPGEPKVEAFAGTRTGTEVHHCAVRWFFDDVEQMDLAGGNVNSGHGIYDLGWGIIWRSGVKRYLYFRQSKIFIEYHKWEWRAWGCAMNMCVCLPETLRNENLVGILGSADGNPDNDYMDRAGNPLTGPEKPVSIADNNAYCQEQWCLGEGQPDANIFKTPINSCGATLPTDELDIAVDGASEELKELCLFNRDCIVDAIVANDSTLGTRTLENEADIEKHEVDPNRNPEDGQEEDEVAGLPIERFSGGKVCKQFDDYDFGFKLWKCKNGKSGDFDSLVRTNMRNEATCDGSTNPGTFELECFESLGNDKHKTFKFTPSVDTAVKIKGKNSNTNGNILYKDLKAGTTYDFTDIGNGEWIQELEFCFRCPDLPEPTCPEDVKECPDGTFVQRQAPSCEFRECPVCPADEHTCPDGTVLSRDITNGCEFPTCPACDDGTLECPSGEILTRDPATCEFPECPVVETESESGDESDGTSESGDESDGTSGDEPSGDEPSGDEPSGDEPSGDEPSGDEPSGDEPSGDEPSGDEPSGDEPSGDEPSGDEPSGDEPSGDEPSGDEPSVEDEPMTTNAPPGTRGDPHFKTHGGDMFDFHGGCDLVLVDNPGYKNGLGLTIHIRTKIETWWSFVESAVIKIGKDTLEVTGRDADVWMWLNGAAQEELEDDKWNKADLAGNLLRFKASKGLKNGQLNRHEAHIYLGNGEKIVFKTFNDFLKVEFMNESEATLAGSHGILGTYPEGNRAGRDGVTLIEDVNAYGQEWQVTADEPKLFHAYDDAWVVPAGTACAMPSSSAQKVALRRRRLESGIATEAAEKACSHLSGADAKACVYDVLATQDVNMAGAW